MASVHVVSVAELGCYLLEVHFNSRKGASGKRNMETIGRPGENGALEAREQGLQEVSTVQMCKWDTQVEDLDGGFGQAA